MLTWFELLKRQVKRETCLHLRDARGMLNACLFFLLVCIFFPLSLPPEQPLLRTLFPGLIWIAVLLSLFLSTERLFHPDDEEGVLDQWLVSGYPIGLFVFAKLMIHWCVYVLPMVLMSPCLMILFHIGWHEMFYVIVSLLAGTPALLMWCAVAAGFATGLKQKNMLMGLVIFPLTIPVMILGSSTIDLAMAGICVDGQVALLLAISCLAVGFLPFAIAGILRASMQG